MNGDPADDDPLVRAQRAALIGISTLRTALDLAESIVADRDRFDSIVGRGKGVADGLFAEVMRRFAGSTPKPSEPPPEEDTGVDRRATRVVKRPGEKGAVIATGAKEREGRQRAAKKVAPKPLANKRASPRKASPENKSRPRNKRTP